MIIQETERMRFPDIQGNCLFYYVLDGIWPVRYRDGCLRCKVGQLRNLRYVQRQQHEILPIYIFQPFGNCPASTHHIEKQLDHSIIIRIHRAAHAALYLEMHITKAEITAMQITVSVPFMLFQHPPVITDASPVPAFRFHVWFYDVQFCFIG